MAASGGKKNNVDARLITRRLGSFCKQRSSTRQPRPFVAPRICELHAEKIAHTFLRQFNTPANSSAN
jgi:hypothetical protein